VEASNQPPVEQEPHINADTEESRSGDGSESEYEDDPNAAESEVDDADDENSVAECDDREDDQGGEDTQGASLRHPGTVETHFEPLGYADAEPSDANLVLGEIEKSIESDEEGKTLSALQICWTQMMKQSPFVKNLLSPKLAGSPVC
ncbi:hypothetical protein L914_12980, partial [Phytophthora nicotianae]